MNTEVLIAGGGPTGLALAAELAKYGVSFRIIDTARAATDLSKAIGVQSRTLEMLDIMGIADELVACGNQATSFTVCDDQKQLVTLDFSGIGNRFPYLLAVPQSETERVLESRLKLLGGNVERSTELVSFEQSGDSVRSILKHEDGSEETVESRWLAGCDGAHSVVRHGLGLPFEGEEYADRFLLADARAESPDLKDNELYLFLHDGYLTAFFGLPGGHWRIIADFKADSESTGEDKTTRPSLAECQKIVNERSPFPIELSDLKWSSYYQIHRRIVPKLQVGNVFLAGDAAHIHSPAAAQGMNTGIQDAINLAWKIAYVSKGHSDGTLLDTYNSERYPVEKGVLALADNLLKLVSLRQPIARGIRDALMPIITHTRIFQETMRDRISELAISYGPGAIVVESAQGLSGPNSGERAPDASVLIDGRAQRLYELWRNGKANLLIFGPEPGDDSVELAELSVSPDVEDQYFVPHEGCAHEAPAGFKLLEDTRGELRERYSNGQPCAYLIRPDGYIGIRSTLGQLPASLAKWLDSSEK